MTATQIAEALNYRRAAVRVLGQDTLKGRHETDTRLRELDMVVSHLAGALFPNDPQARDEFATAAGRTR